MSWSCFNCPYALALWELCIARVEVGADFVTLDHPDYGQSFRQPDEMKRRRRDFDLNGRMEPHEIELDIPKEWLKDEVPFAGGLMLVECERRGSGASQTQAVHRNDGTQQ